MSKYTFTDWEAHYRDKETPWDCGAPHPELVNRFRAGDDDRRVLVAGCGFGHDAVHFGNLGLYVLGLAGLNPHAGEVGILGSEEQEVLIPARDAARDEGLDVEGPLSPDSMFAAANRRRFDGLLTLYHDQAFLPLKLLAKDRGVTVLAGLPYPRVSPIHGTAYDLVGTGKASDENLGEAVHVAPRIARHWKTTNRA